MDFSFNDDQVALRNALGRFCDREFPLELQGKPLDATGRKKRWRAMADFGLLGLTVSEVHGGSGLTAVDLMIVAEELGKSLEAASYFSHVVLAAQLVEGASSQNQDPSDQKPMLQPKPALEQMVRGQHQAVLALYETGSRHDWYRVKTRAHWQNNQYLLNGRKTLVLEAAAADSFYVLARSAESVNERDGLSVFAVPANTPGLSIRSYDTIDGRSAADLELEQVALPHDALIGKRDQAYSLVERALLRGDAFLCAETVGVMDALMDQCTEHLRTRQQFGAPLAKFQVLQHKIADMVIALEQLRSMACASAMAIQFSQDPLALLEARAVVSAARVLSARWGREAAQSAIQMHGAMGMTEELRLSHFAKRLIGLSQLHGDVAFHTRAFAQARLESQNQGQDVFTNYQIPSVRQA